MYRRRQVSDPARRDALADVCNYGAIERASATKSSLLQWPPERGHGEEAAHSITQGINARPGEVTDFSMQAPHTFSERISDSAV
jgi:hypothetical protein